MCMRRAVTFVTPTMLLLAVAGVTFVQEGVFGGQQPGDAPVEGDGGGVSSGAVGATWVRM